MFNLDPFFVQSLFVKILPKKFFGYFDKYHSEESGEW